jgi:hypothetical protein
MNGLFVTSMSALQVGTTRQMVVPVWDNLDLT